MGIRRRTRPRARCARQTQRPAAPAAAGAARRTGPARGARPWSGCVCTDAARRPQHRCERRTLGSSLRGSCAAALGRGFAAPLADGSASPNACQPARPPPPPPSSAGPWLAAPGGAGAAGASNCAQLAPCAAGSGAAGGWPFAAAAGGLSAPPAGRAHRISLERLMRKHLAHPSRPCGARTHCLRSALEASLRAAHYPETPSACTSRDAHLARPLPPRQTRPNRLRAQARRVKVSRPPRWSAPARRRRPRPRPVSPGWPGR